MPAGTLLRLYADLSDGGLAPDVALATPRLEASASRPEAASFLRAIERALARREDEAERAPAT